MHTYIHTHIHLRAAAPAESMFSFGNKDAILEVNLDSHDLE
jgi:hypothetical protein